MKAYRTTEAQTVTVPAGERIAVRGDRAILEVPASAVPTDGMERVGEEAPPAAEPRGSKALHEAVEPVLAAVRSLNVEDENAFSPTVAYGIAGVALHCRNRAMELQEQISPTPASCLEREAQALLSAIAVAALQVGGIVHEGSVQGTRHFLVGPSESLEDLMELAHVLEDRVHPNGREAER